VVKVKDNAGKVAVDRAAVEDSSAVDRGDNVPVPDKVFRPVDSPVGDNAKVRRKDKHKHNHKVNLPLLHKAVKPPKGKKENRHHHRSCRCRRRMKMPLR